MVKFWKKFSLEHAFEKTFWFKVNDGQEIQYKKDIMKSHWIWISNINWSYQCIEKKAFYQFKVLIVICKLV